MKKRKRLYIAGGILLFLLVLAEGVGRYYGLANQPLFREDPDFEYIAQPNQRLRIYRHKYVTNQFSMRSEPVLPEDTLNAIVMGDSIMYGTTATDQDSLATTLLEKTLTDKLKHRVRVLNISTPSWGPDNLAAYLKKYGTFHAKIIILVTSSADAHDNMTYEHVLGKGVYLGENNTFAVKSIIEKAWYLIKIRIWPDENLAFQITKESKDFNPGFQQLDSICKANHIQFYNYLHTMERTELKNKQLDKGGLEIVDFLQKNNIPYTNGLDVESPDLFLDGGHFSNKGQRWLANYLEPIIVKAFEKQ